MSFKCGLNHTEQLIYEDNLNISHTYVEEQISSAVFVQLEDK